MFNIHTCICAYENQSMQSMCVCLVTALVFRHTYVHIRIHTNSSERFVALVTLQLRPTYIHAYTNTHNSSESFGALVTRKWRVTYVYAYIHTHTQQ